MILKDLRDLLEIILILALVIPLLINTGGIIFKIISILSIIILCLHIGQKYSNEIKILLGWIYGILKIMDKKKIGNEFEGKIDRFSERISSEMMGREPCRAKIKWVTGKEGDYFKNGNLILRIKDSGNPNKNFIIVAMRFITKTIIPETKQYLHKTLSKSIDLFMVKKLLDEENKYLTPLFYQYYFYPEIQKDPKIKNCLDYYMPIDRAGIFTRIFIQELLTIGGKAHFIYGPEDSQITKEVVNLLKFLESIATEKRIFGLDFNGEFLKTGIIIVAEEEKRERGEPEKYIQRVGEILSAGAENIYITAWGQNINFAKTIIHYLNRKQNLVKVKEYPLFSIERDRGKTKALLVLYKKKQ